MKKTVEKVIAIVLCAVMMFGTITAGAGGFTEVLEALFVKASAETNYSFNDLSVSITPKLVYRGTTGLDHWGKDTSGFNTDNAGSGENTVYYAFLKADLDYDIPRGIRPEFKWYWKHGSDGSTGLLDLSEDPTGCYVSLNDDQATARWTSTVGDWNSSGEYQDLNNDGFITGLSLGDDRGFWYFSLNDDYRFYCDVSFILDSESGCTVSDYIRQYFVDSRLTVHSEEIRFNSHNQTFSFGGQRSGTQSSNTAYVNITPNILDYNVYFKCFWEHGSSLLNYSNCTCGENSESCETYYSTSRTDCNNLYERVTIEINGDTFNDQVYVSNQYSRTANYFKGENGSFLTTRIVDSEIIPGTGWVRSRYFENEGNYQVGDIIEYGNYPQSRVTDQLTLLNLAMATLNDNWVSYDYYSGTGNFSDGQMQPGDFMKYQDVVVNGEKYRGVKFTEYRPVFTGYESSADNTYQDDNGYTSGSTYWFKFEPVKWRVLDPNTGLIVCDSIIDSQAYNNFMLYTGIDEEGYLVCYGDSEQTYYASNYAKSSIRQWLNADFYNTAFSPDQKENIKLTSLNNDCAFSLEGETGFDRWDAPSTDDRVFLLSLTEAAYNNDMIRQGSDYAKCQGLYVENNENEFAGNSYLWLRTPLFPNCGCSATCSGGLGVDSSFEPYVSLTSVGICPAMRLEELESDTSIFIPSAEPHKYNIDYIIEGQVFASQQYEAGETVTAPVAPERDGYVFGWSAVPKTMPDVNITVTGVYTSGDYAYKTGDIIQYGTYPQSEVTDDNLLANLNTVSADTEWTSYNYCSGTIVLTEELVSSDEFQTNDFRYDDFYAQGEISPSDIMLYKDVVFGGNKYRAVRIDSYRPVYTPIHSGPCPYYVDTSNQYNNGYEEGNVYWFKYEPIKWRVLDPSTGLILCDSVLDSQPYHNYLFANGRDDRNCINYYGDSNYTYYANNYAESSIRQWLNEDFYNTAFSTGQKANIAYTALNNDGREGYEQYGSAATNDKVFLLSLEEATNSAYGFDAGSNYNYARVKADTDYAKCQGSDSSLNHKKYSQFWGLRTPSGTSSWVLAVSGHAASAGRTYETGVGVCPAITLTTIRNDTEVAPVYEKYNVTFMIDGEVFDTFECAVGETITAPTAPSRDGYAFSWTDIPETMPACDVTIVGTYTVYSTGDIIERGSYPQSRVTDEALIAELNSQPSEWISYGYYSGTGNYCDGKMKPSDYMKYKDVSLSGTKYRAVTFSKYRPDVTYDYHRISYNYNYQEQNGYDTNTVYWFRYEPVKWRVLDPATGLVMCDSIIDSQAYNNYVIVNGSYPPDSYWGDPEQTYFASNYANSDIRQWLNDDFYNTAFSSDEKLDIKTTTLNNGCRASLYGNAGYEKYDSPSTDDKIFLLSYLDVSNGEYGFNPDISANDTARRLHGSDYAKCQGLQVNNDSESEFFGESIWWLRTPVEQSSGAYSIKDSGYNSYSVASFATYDGVCPAMRLTSVSTGQTYRVRYYIDGEIIAIQEYAAGETVIFPSVSEREGYTFSWIGSDILDVMPACDVDIIGEYSANLHRIKWKVDGTSFTQNLRVGDAITAPSDPEKAGYAFAGWTPQIPETMPDEDLEFTATWTALKFTVTWSVDGVETTEQVDCGAAITQPASPEKEGYIFTGWTPSVPETMPAGNQTFYATFVEKSYKLAFVVNGEETSEMVKYGAEITAPEDPSVEGFRFKGWDSDIPGTMPSHDVTITAILTPVYSITIGSGEEEIEIDAGEEKELDITVTPEPEEPIDFTWTSSDENVATVDEDGTVTGVSCGETEITVSTDEGDSATVTVIINHKYTDETVDPTCTEGGYDKHTCSVCGDEYKDNNTDALGHNYKDEVTEPNCTEGGYTKHTCQRCGHEYIDGILPANGHTYRNDIIEPGCTEGGYIQHTCVVCGYTYTSDEIPAKGHSYEVTTIDPTCTEDGYDIHTCSVCGDEYKDNYVDAPGHDYKDEVVESSCTGGGYTKHVCQKCGNEYTDSTSPANGHTYRNEIIEPTCTEGGYTLHTCTVCGYTYVSDETSANGHSYSVTTVDPTCTEDGYDDHICSSCGDEFKDNYVEASGHNYKDEVVEPNCTEGGYTKHTCQKCGDEYTDGILPANGHTYRNDIVEPTCTLGGYILHTCTTCGYSYISDETPAKGHTYKATVVEPTCDDEGYTVHTCVDCGDTYNDTTVPAEGHHYTDVTVVEPTCTEAGYTLHKCTGCDDSYITDEVPANGHNFETLVQQATCTQEGGTVYTCKVCGFAKIDDKSPALGHNYIAKVTPATCGVAGFTTYTCSRCGGNYISDETPALEHNYEPFEVHTTCVQDGCTISICSNCGRAKRSEITPATGHNFGSWAIVRNASETEEGLEQRRCIKCGYTEDRLIPMLERTTYFATFVADGKTVSTVEFIKGATSIEEPAVPHKDRYEGKWSAYTLTDSDITVSAEYTLINLDDLSGIESGKSATYNSATGEATINIFAASEGKTVVSTTSEKVPLDIILVVDQSGSMADRLGGTKTKQQALKTASTDFVNSVYADAVENGVDHRIAIVGFGMGSQSAQGYSAYQNTEILTTGGNPIQYNNATAQNYTNALVDVNNGGNLNAAITTAINNIDAKGATAADYGLSMANSIFANTDGEGRQRIVVFMTDGAPTYKSDFSKDVANAAVLQANQIKNTYGATVYSVGVMSSSEAANSNIDTFMNYVSSNYADAENIGRTYTKQNDSFYISVNNTNALSGVFTEIVTENITRTTDFDNLTVIDTISKYFTLTEKQERELRIAAIETYGVKNSDITVTRNNDGTTTVILKNLHPVDDGTKFSVNLSFRVSADEDALKAGTYATNTEDAGLIIGDGENYECVFDAPSVNIPADRTLSVFKINGEVYALLNADSANIPETDFIGDYEFTGWNLDAGTEIEEGVTEYNAVYVSKQDYVLIWNTDEGTQRLTVTPGDIIDEPTPVPDNAGNTFRRWNGEVPVTMPADNLEFTAVYGDHEHNYEAEIITPVTCLADGSTKYTCSICGHTYTETVACPGEHKWIAVTGSANTETGYEEFECEVCGEHCERTLEYTVTGTDESGSGTYNSITTELNYVNANGSNTQPDGNVNIVVPVSDYFDGAEDVDVYRVDGDGNRTQCESEYSDGILSFFTNHFSTYEFVATYGSTEPCTHKDENNDGSCDICGDPMTYTKDIIVDGNKIGEVTFTYGDTELTGLPEVPVKPGYTGEWDYIITGSELQIQAKYTLITYYATFMADGKQVGEKVSFTVESTSITAPDVPAKEGYTGKWSEYALAASDITVNAIYTKIDTPTPPNEYKLPTSFRTQSAPYNTIVTVTVTLNNVPSNATVYIDGKPADVNGNRYSAEIGQLGSGKDVSLEVRQGNAVIDSANLRVEVDSTFFGKLMSFFSNFLFNMFSWKKIPVNF